MLDMTNTTTELSAEDLREVEERLTEQAERLRRELAEAEAARLALYDDCELDAADIGSRVTAVEQLQADTGRARDLLEQTDAALERLRAGTLGRCTACGGPVARERVLAVPHADQCVTCRAGRGR
ncbi:TraR/DksA family transcriptional regulator [Streptomyces minutiscleroticus]|uniref:Zinc finger DksA/TraR C4-type domain-containing protein n=1 Tax=Streptomyces minutiscleroticus TaxID=68238 RepID=A0A918NTV9_9ACTN|nr:TraR/DksA C4-type zinc finger protein [Streptomyces minutiscleroticus]GGX94186.1 hypothetical protein GCM10010358_55050 [Streptomyces minutiscleroticus]